MGSKSGRGGKWGQDPAHALSIDKHNGSVAELTAKARIESTYRLEPDAGAAGHGLGGHCERHLLQVRGPVALHVEAIKLG